ncbi:DNA-binding transcriptional regulator, LysR family [Desulfocicer vacuolatum DSM 3385]|uniref:DNA-binding transcriptional regulator, LysR family n=1 Tax=Desulfocicer vacuolatum DSM 3385 TaxID=1121400 RepID=A0A1W2DJH7_9BACT|nr:LysR family transcriptional regulator [Desulfocicer vacuolatum]SMC97613.1 DNA-binding transcriptional regulator, LysR family [Desulfocicer vacuolatum DSM 3385]
MDLNKLNTFYVLAQMKSYSKCAKKRFVTQSAVSHAIKTLEESLNLTLVEKNRKTFALTSEGKILFKSCQKIFYEVEKTQDLLMKTKKYPELIRMGSTVEFGVSVLLKGMEFFFENHPDIHVDFTLSHSLIQPLLDDELDVIIDCKPHVRPDLETIVLFREEYAVIASPRYVKKNKITKVEDLTRCNIFSQDHELAWWRNFIHALPLEKQVIFDRVTRINHVRGMINAALSNMGVGFVPRYTVLRELEEGSLVELFPELDILNDHINIYLKRRNLALAKFQHLIAHIKEFRLQ